MKDRFDLEDEISELHNTASAIDLLIEDATERLYDVLDVTVLEQHYPIIKKLSDSIEALRGQAHLLRLQANRLHDTMCSTLGLDQGDVV